MTVVAAGLLGYVVGWLDHRADLPDGWSVVSGEARVIDGDTLEIEGVRIRLHGLDAPERYQRCLTAAGEKYRCGVRAGSSLRSLLQTNTSSPGVRPGDLPRWALAEGDYRVSSAFPVAAKAARRLWPGNDEMGEGTKIPATITCLSHDTDRWGRRIARCFTEDGDINRRMVQQGHALAYRRYSREYDIDEAYALRHQRGLWAGRFASPQAWRDGERLGE